MFVARSYRYGSPTSHPRESKQEKNKTAADRPRPLRRDAYETQKVVSCVQELSLDPEVFLAPSTPVAVPSPTRSENSSRTPSRRGSRRGRKDDHVEVQGNHDASAIPPAVAALLAMTSIPPYKNRMEKRQLKPRSMSLSELVEEWNALDMGDDTLLSSSPNMELLLSSPDEEDTLDRCDSSDSIPDPFPFAARSQSNESMPSLDSDCQSLLSSCEPFTPQASLRSIGASKKDKYMSSPESIDSVLDHPLLHGPVTTVESQPPPIRKDSFKPAKPSKLRIQRSMSSFRSNLTASFESLRAAASSISNFSIASIPPDDYLSRSLLSSPTPLQNEMRPKFFSGTPSAEFRRYMNPDSLAPRRTGTPLDFHLHNSYIDQTDLATVYSLPSAPNRPYSPCVIPLQTYEKGDPDHSCVTQDGDLANTEAGRAMLSGLKQREPRENSHFLRVCVLEMNMRREGKFDPNAAFKAQFWLPPRRVQLVQAREEDKDLSPAARKVPARWRGVAAV